jgi:hypothetical protein
LNVEMDPLGVTYKAKVVEGAVAAKAGDVWGDVEAMRAEVHTIKVCCIDDLLPCLACKEHVCVCVRVCVCVCVCACVRMYGSCGSALVITWSFLQHTLSLVVSLDCC